MKEIYAIINQKGGVGKSTTALAIAGGLSRMGLRVLAIDLDAQGNFSYTMRTDEQKPNVLDVLTGTSIADAIQHADGIDIVASTAALAGADLTITETGKEYRLREALAPVLDNYDYIVIDTPPALGILTINALSAATSFIIPAQADIYSLQGIGQLYSTYSAVKRYTNPHLRIAGILITRYSPRAILSRDISETIEATARQLETRVFEAKIRESIVVKEAQASQQSLFAYAPRNNATLDYEQFLVQLLERSEANG